MGTLWFQVLTLMITESDLEVCFVLLTLCVCACVNDNFEREARNQQLQDSHGLFKIDYNCEECLQTNTLSPLSLVHML